MDDEMSSDHSEDDIGIDIAREETERASPADNNNHLFYDVFSLCSSSSDLKSVFGPIKKPIEIPRMLFNTLPVPPESSSSASTSDRRWKGPEKSHSGAKTSAPSVPVRTTSIDEILGSALAIIESPATSGSLESRRKELSARKNHSWDESDFVTIADYRKRWREDSAPVIPRRKTSATSLEEALRRNSWPGSPGRAAV